MASYRDVRSAVVYSSDESSSDSDVDEDQPWKRRKTGRQPQGIRREAGQGPRGPGLPLGSVAAGGEPQKKPKKNNIWGQVALEQTEAQVAQEMDGFDMDLPRCRDVESYDYRLGRWEGGDNDDECRAHRSHLGAPSITKLDSNRPQGLKRGFGETEEDGWLADQPEDEQDGGDDDNDDDVRGRKPVKERLGTREPATRPMAKARSLSGRSKSPAFDSPMRFIEIKPSLSRKEIMGKLAYSLQEAKRELIVRVVNVLGVDKSLELWRQTADVEKSGGMLVLNGSRRRAPGGVFLQLMKTDPEVTKAQVKEIFAEERKKENEEKHKRDRRRRKQAAQLMGAEDGGMDGKWLGRRDREGDGGDEEVEEGEDVDRGSPEGAEAPAQEEPAEAGDKEGGGNGLMEDGEIGEEEEEMG